MTTGDVTYQKCSTCGDTGWIGIPGGPCPVCSAFRRVNPAPNASQPRVPSPGGTLEVGAPTSVAVPQQQFGIIDPDYARIYTQVRIIAWSYGFACLAHGSFTRDLDIVLVPWTVGATRAPKDMVAHIADVTSLKVQGEPTQQPHGRQTWTLLLPGFGEVRWVDLSIFPSKERVVTKHVDSRNIYDD